MKVPFAKKSKLALSQKLFYSPSIKESEEEHSLKTAQELGENKIIEIILKNLDPMPNMCIPFGDDVSAINVGKNRLVVIKADMLVGKTDIPPTMSLWQAARKAVIMNISDLAAKGVKTTALLTSVGIPREFSQENIEEIAKGQNSGAREYDAYIIGGDTNESNDLILSVVAFGIGEKDCLMLRSGAKAGDLVAVTGYFGKTSAGLRVLLQNLTAPPRLRKTLVDSVLMPHARLKEGFTLAKTNSITASIDSSDGLAFSLHELSIRSNVGFVVDNLPIAEEAVKFAELHALNPTELCLYGGEEYELLVTLNPRVWKKIERKVPLIKIGWVTEDTDVVFKAGNKAIPIEPRGWEHFKTSL